VQVQIPVYVELFRGTQARVSVRPLFIAGFECTAPSLDRALQKLRNLVHQHLLELSRMPDQSALLPWLEVPDYQTHRLQLRVHDGEREQLGELLWVSYRALDRQLIFTAKHPAQHAELSGERVESTVLNERAAQVLGQWLKRAKRKNQDLQFADLVIAPEAQVRLSALELDFNPHQRQADKKDQDRAGIGGGSEQLDGAKELAKVGRLVNQLYPDHLQRGIAIDDAVDQLINLLQQTNRRAVLLLGQSGVGKTTVVHEALYRLQQRRTSPAALAAEKLSVPRIWLVSPQRLISGMSYLGQWEARLLAILRHLQDRDVLYFDDLLGLLDAGKSSGSDLAVVDLLLPWIDKRKIRVIAEMTPEAWRVLRERRRDLADLFEVLPIEPMPDDQRWRVLAALTRELEQSQDVRFDLSAVPCAMGLSTRYTGEREFPGNIADVLRRIATRASSAQQDLSGAQKQVSKLIDRHAVIADFSRRLGLSLELLDRDVVLDHEMIMAQLRQHLKGQEQAQLALANAILRSKTGMNDPKRPLAVMLLLGPTGVGKTQCAKALAKVIAPHQDALLRFDLNEYTDASDAARLVGTWAQPDGLLTAAIRRTPTAVLLFDEIEKAAPEVFDMLLSVLDEGRLTDAHGRVADFTRAYILLTSNLGAKQAATQLGFTGGVNAQSQFIDAAKRFFRPEFFNRLDEVIGFSPFNDAQLAEITRQLIDEVLTRSGLRARQCLIVLDDAARKSLQAIGQDPNLGARALKRGIERALVQPLARHLSVLHVNQPMRICVTGIDQTLSISVQAFAFAERWPQYFSDVFVRADITPWVDVVDDYLQDLDQQIELMQPVQGIELGAVTIAMQHYFACREQQRFITVLIEKLRRAPSKALRHPARSIQHRALGERKRLGNEGVAAHARSEVDLALHLQDLPEPGEAVPLEAEQARAELRKLIGALAWLVVLMQAPSSIERIVLEPRSLPERSALDTSFASLAEALRLLPGCISTQVKLDPPALVVEGFAMQALLSAELGWTLAQDGAGVALSGFAIRVEGADAETQLIEPKDIIRKLTSRCLDVRSQISIETNASAADRLSYLLAHLPWPLAEDSTPLEALQ
jgi:ATP-dependent Clp protease ATP-binding subunit ClpC